MGLELAETRRVSLSLVFGVIEVKDGLEIINQTKKAIIACTGMCCRMQFLYLQHVYVFWTANDWCILIA